MMQVTPIRDLKAYLEPEQVERLIAAATNPRDVLLVQIPWHTGVRASELTAIREQDIDFENRAIAIKVQKMRKKDGKVIERRRLGQYRCWLCGKDLQITTPPYLRAGCCRCEEEELPGGWCDPPRDWSEESIDKARREYARKHEG